MFKVGDKVRSVVDIYGNRVKGKIYEIVDVDSIAGETVYYYYNDTKYRTCTNNPETFELVENKVLDHNEKKIEIDKKTLQKAMLEAFADFEEQPFIIELVAKKLGL